MPFHISVLLKSPVSFLKSEQIGLESLGFNPDRTRGMFARSHKPSASSDKWDSQRFIVVPDADRDLVKHFDSHDVAKDVFQVLGFGTSQVQTRPTYRPIDINPHIYGGGMDMRGGEVTRGLGIGFGPNFSQTARTTATSVDSLQAAFQVRVTPKAK